MLWRVIVIVSSLALSLPFLYFKGLKLGLDLKGGSYFVLDVESEKMVSVHLQRIYQEINKLREEGKDEENEFSDILTVTVSDSNLLIIAKSPEVKNLILDKHDTLTVLSETYSEGITKIVFTVRQEDRKEMEEFAVDQALETIRGRVDQFGVAEPSIFRVGNRGIVVQLPGVQSPERAKRIIGKTALLEFLLLDEESNFFEQFKDKLEKDKRTGISISYEQTSKNTNQAYLWSRNYDKLSSFVKEITVPEGRKIFIGQSGTDGRRRGGTSVWRTYLLHGETLLSGDLLRDARVRIDTRYNTPFISLRFSSEGARIFEDVTSANVGKRLAIILDDKVYSAPVIRERITGGNAVIEGNFTMEEARDLATVLRAGALPAPVKIEEERSVGPSLGSDSIRWGFSASAVGALLVVLFMSLYYRIYGVAAVVGLLVNITCLLGILSVFGATLTLPGVAGIALTIGMAVDNNILVFERIREELRKNLPPKTAIENGYKIAMKTILDANITTLIAGILLFQFGTGPVKGFAVTLSAGILTSIYGGVFVTRTITNFLATKKIISV